MQAIRDNLYVKVNRTSVIKAGEGEIYIPESAHLMPENYATSGIVLSAGNMSSFTTGDTVFFSWMIMDENPLAEHVWVKDHEIVFYVRDGKPAIKDGYILGKPIEQEPTSGIVLSKLGSQVLDYVEMADTKAVGKVRYREQVELTKQEYEEYTMATVILGDEEIEPKDTIFFNKHGWKHVEPLFRQRLFDGHKVIIITKNEVNGVSKNK